MNTTTTTATHQTILRNVLTVLGENTVMLHPSARVVAVQPHKKGVEVYSLVQHGEVMTGAQDDPEPRRFYVAKTGETVKEKATYVGSAIFPTMKSRHVFELV